MNKIIKISSLLVSLTSMLTLSGCTTPGKNILPHGDMTMLQIYRAQTGSSIESSDIDENRISNTKNQSVAEPLNDQYSDIAEDQINSEFKLLPNPNIAVYVFPHMSHYNGTNVPIPGYTTTFFLYEKNHYAMPGEAY